MVTVIAQNAVKVRSPKHVLFGGVAMILSSVSPKLYAVDFRLIRKIWWRQLNLAAQGSSCKELVAASPKFTSFSHLCQLVNSVLINSLPLKVHSTQMQSTNSIHNIKEEKYMKHTFSLVQTKDTPDVSATDW